MNLIKSVFSAAATLYFAAALIGCTQPVDCNQEATAPCFLLRAEQSLQQIDDAASFVSAAYEYAEALLAAQRTGEAMQVLGAAKETAARIENPLVRANSYVEIAKGYKALKAQDENAATARLAMQTLEAVEDVTKRNDAIGKIAVLLAAAGALEDANDIAGAMPETAADLASLKARTLQGIAVTLAENSDFAGAQAVLPEIKMGLVYYQAKARSDIAKLAVEANKTNMADRLLREAEEIANTQDDGYFIAGALRNTATVYARNNNQAEAKRLYALARDAALQLSVPQRKARTLSRIATALADDGTYAAARAIFPQAVAIAQTEPSAVMRRYSLYEIAGSAAFAGEWETAYGLLEDIPAQPFGSAASLKAATQRDIAWGLLRHGKSSEATALASAIASPRERVQAFSRMARLMIGHTTQAYPRYL
ncbi:MAG: hypothetical protein AAF862_10145 [Pseudomonadota bacterium]